MKSGAFVDILVYFSSNLVEIQEILIQNSLLLANVPILGAAVQKSVERSKTIRVGSPEEKNHNGKVREWI